MILKNNLYLILGLETKPGSGLLDHFLHLLFKFLRITLRMFLKITDEYGRRRQYVLPRQSPHMIYSLRASGQDRGLTIENPPLHRGYQIFHFQLFEIKIKRSKEINVNMSCLVLISRSSSTAKSPKFDKADKRYKMRSLRWSGFYVPHTTLSPFGSALSPARWHCTITHLSGHYGYRTGLVSYATTVSFKFKLKQTLT